MPNLDLIDLKRYETQKSDKETSKTWDDDSIEKLLEAQNLAKTKLKQIVRRGVPDGIRSIVWPEFLKMHKMPEYEKNYTKALFRVHGSKPPDQLSLCPLFSGSMFTEWMCLTQKGYLVAGRMLSVIAYDYPHIEFCPFLPVLSVLMLHHVGPDDTFGSINWMIRANMAKPDSWVFFPTYKKDIKALNYAFSELVKTQLPKVWKHLELLNNTDKPLWVRWFCDFFIGVLPLDVVFHILDSFLIEGYKVLLRYALALVELRSSAVLACVSWDEATAVFKLDPPKPSGSPAILPSAPPSAPSPVSLSASSPAAQQQSSPNKSSPPSPNAQSLPSPTSPIPANAWKGSRETNIPQLLKLAFSYKFSKRKLLEFRNAHHLSRSAHREGSLPDIHNGAAQLIDLPKLLHSEESAFMTTDDWLPLWQWVPPRHRVAALELAFTTRKHGRSLATFYDLCREREPTLLLIETMDGDVIGAYCPVSWPLSNREFNRFFGTGETFVFTLRRKGKVEPKAWPWVLAYTATSPQVAGGNAQATTQAAAATTTGTLNLTAADATNSFMWAGNKELIVGGGGKSQAIWIEQNMVKGSTGPCSTFNNQPLCGTGSFEISVLEVFSFRLTQ
ncbi:TLD-domain-containing protein [Catenaria anguillulae PL171]|uniref:TLD-domain-containing protein n=1 Tax=Catenaria anguillulae PL171 TaxID=765915 RepID=A0A1Y2I314_9FUNG|nr:TLD-domain-containing protein [Catenaria anguillulae PL171]